MDAKQFFGGSIAGTLIRLALISIVVGVVLSALGIHPQNIVQHLQLLVRRIYDLGFGAIEWAFHYFLLGAVIVMPVWLVVRLVRTSRRADDPGA